MKIKDNPNIKLPSLTEGSFSGMDRLYFSHKDLILKKVRQREDNGNIEITTQAKDGREKRTGWIEFKDKVTVEKKNLLYNWLLQQKGENIEFIYNYDLSLLSKQF